MKSIGKFLAAHPNIEVVRIINKPFDGAVSIYMRSKKDKILMKKIEVMVLKLYPDCMSETMESMAKEIAEIERLYE